MTKTTNLAPHTDKDSKGLYHAGTLRYTKPALAMLFFWLLWGDFCYFLMELVMPSIMPLKFKGLGASNTIIGIIPNTLPWAVNFFLSPIISFKSDRFRSRWGRRIPFIAFSIPFIVVFLSALGLGDQIGHWLQGHLPWVHLAPNTMAIAVLAVLLVLFSVFNTFVNSTFWYLFNDVVPEHLLARFMSWFRVVSMGAYSVFNFYLFPLAATHTFLIFSSAALLYLVSFSLLCLNVREGEYPPPPPYVGRRTGVIAAIKTFAKESLSHRIYLYQYAMTFLGCLANGVGTVSIGYSGFMIFYQTIGLGLSLKQVGDIYGWQTIAVGVLILGSGWLADRFHPIRVVIASIFLLVFLQLPSELIWLFWHPSNAVIYNVMLALNVCVIAPIFALNGVWDPPLFMRLFPRSRFGQFCSTNSMWRAAGSMLGGVMAGVFLDIMTKRMGEARAYLYTPLWQLAFYLPTLVLILLLYRSWKRCGGDDHYVAPLPAETKTPELAEAAR